MGGKLERLASLPARWSRLPSYRKKLLLQALLFLGVIRLALWLVPFRRLRQHLAQVVRSHDSPAQEPQRLSEAVGWAIRRAQRLVPHSTCLVQALAAQALLCRYGVDAQLHIGVSKNEGASFMAHAWTVSGGRVVVGGASSGAFTPLLVLDKDDL